MGGCLGHEPPPPPAAVEPGEPGGAGTTPGTAGAPLTGAQLASLPTLLLRSPADAARQLAARQVGATVFLSGSLVVPATLQLHSLPLPRGATALRVAGHAHLAGLAHLSHLPEHLHVGGDLNLSLCSALQELPPSLHVGGSLRLKGCTRLARLELAHVPGDLDLGMCLALEQLPQPLVVGGDLLLTLSTRLAAVRALSVGGDLRIAGCDALLELQVDQAGGSVRVEDCGVQRLQLPRVGGDLKLLACRELCELPEDLRVDGDVLLECPRMEHLPDALSVGGDLLLAACGQLQSVPAAVLDWPRKKDGGGKHRIVLPDAKAFPEEVREELGQEADNVTFVFQAAA